MYHALIKNQNGGSSLCFL